MYVCMYICMYNINISKLGNKSLRENMKNILSIFFRLFCAGKILFLRPYSKKRINAYF